MPDYASRDITWHRPGLAAAGCWVLVAANLSLPAYWLVERTAPTIFGSTVFSRLAEFAYLQTPFVWLVGVLLIGLADVARGKVNPWPRLLAVAAIVLATAFRYEVLRRLFPPPLAAWGIAIPEMSAYYALSTVREVCWFLVYALGLVYVLQIARWRSSAALATAGAVVLGLASLVAGAIAVEYALNLIDCLTIPTPHRIWEWDFLRKLLLPVHTVLGFFFLVLAIQLHRVAREGR
jgi:hypothetical protein